ncbi:MAG: YhdP family protein [Pseudomonas sp.]
MLWQRWLKRSLDVLIVLLVAWLLLAAAYVSLGRQFVPAIADYQAELLAWAEEKTQRAILLKSLQGEMQGSQPVLSMRGLQVHADADPESPVLFALDDVTARIDIWSSLRQRALVMDALQIEGLALELVEDAEGNWQLYGLGDRRTGTQGLDTALEMLFDQRRITLLQTSILISPYEQPSWQFEQGELTLLNGVGWHRLDGRLSLPDGQQLSWQASAVGEGRHWQDMSVGFFLDIPEIDWTEYLPGDLLGQARLEQLHAGGRFWGNWQARQLHDLQGQLGVQALQLRLEQPFPLIQELHTDFHLQWGERKRLLVQGLDLQLGEQRISDLDFQLTHQPGVGTDLQVQRLALAPLGEILASILPTERAREVLSTLQPQGYLNRLHMHAADDWRHAEDLQLSADFERLAVGAWEGVPALHGLSGQLSGSLAAGRIRLESQEWGLYLPRLFPEPWEYQSAEGSMDWGWSAAEGLSLDAPGLRVLGEEGVVAAKLGLQIPPAGGTPSMDLRVALRDTRADYHARYLPLRAPGFNPQLAEWLDAAAFEGEIPLAIFSYQGSLLKAATAEERQIALHLEVREGSLNFQPGWPRLEQVDATLALHNELVSIDQARAQLLDTQLEKVSVHTRRLPGNGAQALHIDGAFQGPLADALSIMQDTPLAEMTGQALADWQGTGSVDGQLELQLALGTQQRPKLRVEWDAQAQRLHIAQLQAAVTDLKGRFNFELDRGLGASDVNFNFLGQPVSADLAGDDSGDQQIDLRGRHRVEQLRTWPLLADLPPGLVDGELAWTARLGIAAARQRLEVRSDLQGLELDLPGSLSKAAAAASPSRLLLELQPGAQRWTFDVGQDMRGLLIRLNDQLRGDIRYRRGPAQEPTEPGLHVSADFDELNLEEWQAWLQANAPGAMDGGEALPLQHTTADVLGSLDLRANRFNGFGQTLDSLAVSGARMDAGWLFDIDQARIRGQVTLPDSATEVMKLNLQRLRLERPASLPVTEALAHPLVQEDPLRNVRPSTLRAMDVSIDQLYWGDDPVGAAAFSLRPDERGAGISGLDLQLRGLHLTGGLDWRDADTQTHFQGSLQAGDIGKVLEAWGYAPTLTSQKFATEVDLHWPGSPAFFALSRSTGQLQLQASNGALQSGEGSADALRVFGLLNFNAFTRRLRLDFSDLFGRGTAYDKLGGDMRFDNGIMHTTSPLVMDGPGAKLQLDGTLDLPASQIDMGMLVTLPVTNNLPLAALIAGAPYIGGALFIADRILGDRVARFASVKYKISGDWQQPTVEFDRAFDNKAALEDN